MVSSKKGRKDSEEANSSSEGRKKEAAGGGQIEKKPGKAKKKESSDISATGKRIIPEMTFSLPVAFRAGKKLAAPDFSVGSVTGAIQNHSDYRSFDPAVGDDAPQVGQMVLDAEERQTRTSGVKRGIIIGMEVVHRIFRVAS